ncbi:MAG: hypothetical protein AAGA91_16490 [Pseudomonadota bacterium]
MLRRLTLCLGLASILGACDPVVPIAPIEDSEFEGFTVYSVIPDNPVGIVYLFHGSGGSANFALKIETLDQSNELVRRGYGWVATESTERDGNRRWNVNNPSIASNQDLARLARLHAHIVDSGAVTDATPIFGIGMSNGARMVTLFGQVFADNGYPIVAVAPVMGRAAPSVQLAGGLQIPGYWVNAVNDTVVPPAGVAQDQQASAALGVTSVLARKGEENLLPIRFTRIPAVDVEEAELIYDQLAASGVWDANGKRVVDLGTAVSIVAGLTPPPGTGATVTQIRNQISALLALHQFTALYALPLADFFDAQRLAAEP